MNTHISNGVNKNLEEKIKKTLDEVKPMIVAHGGDIEYVSFDEKTGVVKVRLQGACSHCPMSKFTLKNSVEAELKNKIPEIKSVESVT